MPTIVHGSTLVAERLLTVGRITIEHQGGGTLEVMDFDRIALDLAEGTLRVVRRVDGHDIIRAYSLSNIAGLSINAPGLTKNWVVTSA